MYYIMFIFILSNFLYGNNSCTFNKDTGFSDFKIYTKNKDVYILIDITDYRYGIVSTIYNAVNCKKVASGEKTKSKFEKIFKEKDFSNLKIEKSGKYLSNSLSNIIELNQNNSSISVKVSFIDDFTIFELNNLLSMVSNKNITFNKKISNKIKNIINYEYFIKLFFKKIKNTPKNKVNYQYSFWLNSFIKNNYNIELKLIDNIFSLNVKNIKDIPKWIKIMKNKYKKENIISKFHFYKKIIKLSDFGKEISLNNSLDNINTFLNTFEYKYAFKYLKPKITPITKDDEKYGINIKYPFYSKKINFIDNHLFCKNSGIFEEEKKVKCNLNDLCKKVYTKYHCKADKNELSKIKKLEEILIGEKYISKNLEKYGWNYYVFLKYNIIEKGYYNRSSGSSSKNCIEVYTTCAPGYYPCRMVQTTRYICN